MSVARAVEVLASRCERIAAVGTDPLALAHVLAWTVRPRRGLDGLRRRCRDTAQAALDDAAAPAQRLQRAARPELDAGDAELAVGIADAWAELGCVIALVGDPAYPSRVAEGWPDLEAPTWLVRRGTVPDAAPAVAIVGARRATGYGTAVAAWLAEAAARAGARVVSGGAVGIDAAAHRAAHELPGGTTVVLGCGHRIDYPRPHARPGGLFDAIVEHGGTVLSELLPDEPPRAGPVRARNRIVAALADVVVVVEGGDRSGALLTAGAAAERGRSVLAVPGDVRAPGSAAPHRLLQEGVAPCTGPQDLLEALGSASSRHEGGRAADEVGDAQGDVDGSNPLSALPPPVHAVLAAAWPRPVRIEDLAVASGRPIGSLLAALTRGRVAGELAEDTSGVRLRRAPGS